MFIRSKTLGHSKRLFHLSLGAFLVFLGVFTVCSIVDFSNEAEATDVSSKFTVSLNDVLTISSPSEIVLDNCNPSTASLCTTSANVTVSTNNLTGYSLYLNSTSGSSNSLTNTATTPNPTIPTLNNQYSSANFPVNSWGYTGGTDQSGETGGYNCSTNYCPILDYEADPEDYSPNHIIKQTDTPAATSTANLTFAAKADTSKASGTYTTSVTFTAVANEVPASPITDGMDMQDIDSATCAATPLYSESNTTYTVVDTRDNEQYIIAKLADDNCWMLDNMRLDLTNSTVLNSLTTDNTNVDSASLTSLKSGNRAADNRYASSGFEIWDSSHTTNQYNQAKANADYKNTTTTSYGAGSGKIGVYYNYCAASAGNYCYDYGAGVDDTSTLQDAEYDICPKHWRMPTSDTTGEYQALLIAYNNNQTATDSGSLQYNLSTPLSGSFYSGSASYQGSYGYFWSSTWYYANYMSYLFVSASTVSPSSYSDRGIGFSVRCLVPGA